MVFNSLHFVVFFLVVYAVYCGLPHRGQNWLLLAASYYFYGSWDWRFLALLVASTGIDYVCAIQIDRQREPGRRKAALLISLGFNLLTLGFFKYFNFFADSLQTLLRGAGLHADYATLHIVLPIGISFYTFITMSYVIDVYRRDIAPCRNLRDFAVFVAYFPHLVAGPILRADWLLPQIVRPRTIRASQIRDGLWLILWGFFKKVFVADNLAHVADAVFSQTGAVSGADVLLGVYAFAFQIYGDFSGYSDIARGTSLLMGIELNVNFRFPYFVRSAQEFWRHWHISLSTWLRDYLYVPLGGNRHGSAKTKRNLALTMILGGLWHGAAWTYVLWGAYQGALLMAFRTGAERVGRRSPAWMASPWARVIGVVVMFHLTCYGWLIFRANSVSQLQAFTSSLTGRYDFSAPHTQAYLLQLVFFAGPLLALHAYEAWRDDLMVVFTMPRAVRYALCGLLFYMTMLWGEFGGPEFIYFPVLILNMIAILASLGIGTYYLAYYACCLGGLLSLVLLVRRFKARLPRRVGVVTALFVGVSLVRLVLFDNPLMLRAYQHALTVDTLGMRQAGVLDLEIQKYRRDIHQRTLPNLAVGSSQVGAIFYYWASDPPQPLEVYALAGMKALDFVLNEEAIASRHPARVILYLSAFDMTGSPELFSLPLAPPQPLAMWSIYSRLRAVGLTDAETAPSLHAYVGSQLLPEYRYSFIYRALLRKWMNAAPRPEPAPGQRFTDRVTYWDPQWLEYNFSFLDEFLAFCQSRGIEVVVAEGQIDPAAVTPAIADLNRTVRSRITGLRARFPSLHYVPAADVYEFTSADYHDTTHVLPDAARRYTARFSAYLQTRLNGAQP